jgi:hypothetical protein
MGRPVNHGRNSICPVYPLSTFSMVGYPSSDLKYLINVLFPIPVKSTSVVQNGSVDFKLSDQTLNGNLDTNLELENGDSVSSKEVNEKK